MTISPLLVVLGALAAAFLAGFFSFVSLVSAKEARVSEFRLRWIDGLRDEISSFTASIYELVRLYEEKSTIEDKEWVKTSADSYETARKSLTAIHLRLNPNHVKDKGTLENVLMGHVKVARDAFNEDNFATVVAQIDCIRESAAPLLKAEWDKVKKGERSYQRVVKASWALLALFGLLLGAIGYIAFQSGNLDKPAPMRFIIEQPQSNQASPPPSKDPSGDESQPQS